MLIKNIIERMLVRLDKSVDYDLSAEPIDLEIDTMVKCVNMTVSEIATDYMPIRCVESVAAVNGVIVLDTLLNRLIKVISVKANGGDVKWRIYPEFIKIEDCVNSKCDIDYCYLPEQVSLDGNVNLPAQITPELMTFGALAEYCLIGGRYEDSMIYDRRYKESLKEACRNKKEIRVKARIW